jgi:hypothetical protein
VIFATLVGEYNPYGQAPYYALYPHPENSAGGRLCRLILQMDFDEYMESFKRFNLLDTPKWSLPRARAAAKVLAEQEHHERIVLLGAKVAAAFEVDYAPLSRPHPDILVLPHPSGRNRFWNDLRNMDRARAELRDFLGINREVAA